MSSRAGRQSDEGENDGSDYGEFLDEDVGILLRLERDAKEGAQNPQQDEDYVVNDKAGEYWVPISHIDLTSAEAMNNRKLMLESIRHPNRRGLGFFQSSEVPIGRIDLHLTAQRYYGNCRHWHGKESNI